MWHPHTEKPTPLESLLIARKTLCGDKWRLEHGIFIINKRGELMDEKTKVEKCHFGDYKWAYEKAILEEMLSQPYVINVRKISENDKERLKKYMSEYHPSLIHSPCQWPTVTRMVHDGLHVNGSTASTKAQSRKKISDTNKKVTRVINRIRESHQDIEWLYMNGQCYNFALILREMFLELKPEIFYSPSEGHIYTQIGKFFYDIRGRHFKTPKDAVPIRLEKKYARAYRWGRSDTRRLIDTAKKTKNL